MTSAVNHRRKVVELLLQLRTIEQCVQSKEHTADFCRIMANDIIDESTSNSTPFVKFRRGKRIDLILRRVLDPVRSHVFHVLSVPAVCVTDFIERTNSCVLNKKTRTEPLKVERAARKTAPWAVLFCCANKLK